MSDLKPGRELDALIAEKVMGYPHTENYELVTSCPECCEKFSPNSPGRMWCSLCSEWVYSIYKNYSTDISAAWEVVEKMERLLGGGAYEFGLWQEENEVNYGWSCRFATDEVTYEYPKRGDLGLKTAPHAICLAALKVVEEK